MNYPVIILVFIIAVVVAFLRDLPFGFMVVYLPAQLLVSSAPPIPIAFWPHISAPHAAMYGLLGGTMLAGRKLPPLRIAFLDVIILAVATSIVISAGITEDLHAAANMAGNEVVEWILPYFLARLAFHSESARRAGVQTLATCMVVFSIFAFIEFRFRPYFLSRALQSVQLYDGVNFLVYHRFGFMRALLTFGHPIDLGNVALLLLGIIPILAMTTDLGLKNRLVRAGLCATLFILVTAISFTAYFGLAAMAGMFLLLKYVRFFRRHLVVEAIVGIAAVFVYTAIVLSQKLPPRPADSNIFDGSLWMREVIVHRCWAMAPGAGLFGYGRFIDVTELKLNSVDNAYMLMMLVRGWMTVGLFLLIPVALGWRLSRALRRTGNEYEANPLIMAAATVAGIMVAMYTVWFGFVYANIFVVMIGFSATLAEFFLTAPAAHAAEEAPEWIGLAEPA